MVLVTINQSKRLLYFAYIGHVCFQDIKRASEDLTAILEHLPMGFRVLADLERLESMDSASAPEIGKVMEMLDGKGVEISVRVIPDPSKDIGMNILARFHYRKVVRSVTCQTMEEAAKELGL